MTASILSLAISIAVLMLAALIIGREIAVRWTQISDALNHRDPAHVRLRQIPMAVWNSAV